MHFTEHKPVELQQGKGAVPPRHSAHGRCAPVRNKYKLYSGPACSMVDTGLTGISCFSRHLAVATFAHSLGCAMHMAGQSNSHHHVLRHFDHLTL